MKFDDTRLSDSITPDDLSVITESTALETETGFPHRQMLGRPKLASDNLALSAERWTEQKRHKAPVTNG